MAAHAIDAGRQGDIQTLAAANARQRADPLGVKPGLVIEGARIGHAAGTPEARFELPVLPLHDRLTAIPVHAHEGQRCTALDLVRIGYLETPAGSGRLRQSGNATLHDHRLLVEFCGQTFPQGQMVPRQGPGRAGQQRSEQAGNESAAPQQGRQQAGASRQPQWWQGYAHQGAEQTEYESREKNDQARPAQYIHCSSFLCCQAVVCA